MNLDGITATPATAQERAALLIGSAARAGQALLAGNDLAVFKTAAASVAVLCKQPATPLTCRAIEQKFIVMRDVFLSSREISKRPKSEAQKIKLSFDIVIMSCKSAAGSVH